MVAGKTREVFRLFTGAETRRDTVQEMGWAAETALIRMGSRFGYSRPGGSARSVTLLQNYTGRWVTTRVPVGRLMRTMNAIGSTTPAFSQGASSQGTGSRVALRADLTRYEKQLSDCVNCSSAKTPEGKRNIQDLGTRISALKAQLNVAPQASGGSAVEKASSAPASRGIDVYA